MFKLVMRHKRFCKRLLERILKIKIKKITFLENEKSLKFSYDGKAIRLDVYPYKKLRKSIIIFLCPFKLFDQERHQYTFRNRCDEDYHLRLNDGTIKIFLSTEGTINDIKSAT